MAIPTETRPTLKMKTSAEPATRINPEAGREKTFDVASVPPDPTTDASSGCVGWDFRYFRKTLVANPGYIFLRKRETSNDESAQ
jgi:hypothetical protein